MPNPDSQRRHRACPSLRSSACSWAAGVSLHKAVRFEQSEGEASAQSQNRSETHRHIIRTRPSLQLISRARGTASGMYRLFTIHSGAEVVLENLELRGGYVAEAGGAILNRGNLTVRSSSFRGNFAGVGTSSDGGAIYSRADSSLKMFDCTVSGNHATLNGGGISVFKARVHLRSCLILGNEAGRDSGGFRSEWSIVTIAQSNVTANRAGNYKSGGGITNKGGTIAIFNSTIASNWAGMRGGGVWNDQGNMTINSTVIERNEAISQGGGIATEGVDTLVQIESSTIVRNTARSGGAIMLWDGAKVTFKRSTLRQNTAQTKDRGPALYARERSSISVLDTHTRLVDNTDTSRDQSTRQECSAGHRVIRVDEEKLICAPCEAGRFAPGSGYFRCRTCPPEAGFDASKGAASSFPCTCPAGKAALHAKEACGLCPAGTFGGSSGLTSLSQCVDCFLGFYGDTAGASSATQCSACSLGKFSSGRGITADAQCVMCPRGKMGKGGLRNSEASACFACPSGR